MNGQSGIFGFVRTLKAPLSALAILAFVFNILVATSPALAFQALCIGDGSGVVRIAAVFDDDESAPGALHGPHCPLCIPAEDDLTATPPATAASSPGFEGPPQKLAVLRDGLLLRPGPHETEKARAPPFA